MYHFHSLWHATTLVQSPALFNNQHQEKKLNFGGIFASISPSLLRLQNAQDSRHNLRFSDENAKTYREPTWTDVRPSVGKVGKELERRMSV